MKIIGRKKAKMLGLKRYFTGKPCKNGHVCERMISNHDCLLCLRANKEQWAKQNPERSRQINRRAASKYGQTKKGRTRSRKFYHSEKGQLKYVENKISGKKAEAARKWYLKHRKERLERHRKAFLALRALQELGIQI